MRPPILAIVMLGALWATGAPAAWQVRDAAIPAAGSGVVRGVVVTDTLQPLPVRRATVRLAGAGTTVRLVGTDDEGRFTFDQLPSGPVTISAAKAGYVTTFHGATRPGNHLQQRLSTNLLRLYQTLTTIPARERLMRAERWRDKYGEDPQLMLTLGRLCVEESLWGKAEEFLKLGLSAPDPSPAQYALGDLYDGTTMDGPAGLRAALTKHQDVFLMSFTESLMTYALGRRVEYFDMPAIRAIVRDAAKHDQRMSAFILGVVNSAAFQMSRLERTDSTVASR